VGNRGVVDVNSIILAKILEGGASEGCARSVMILLGTPNRCVMSPMNFSTSSDVNFATGQTSIHLVNLSTATRMNLQPPGMVQNGPTESRPHMAKGHDGGIVCRA
jgi:hypothetical protein